MLEIIDFEKKGNQVKFYLGKNGNQWGDDWDDKPYEHNAGTVYDEYIKKIIVINFGFDDIVCEPCDGIPNSEWTKLDMIKRKVPCIVVLKKKDIENTFLDNYANIIEKKKIKKYYFGDTIKQKRRKK